MIVETRVVGAGPAEVRDVEIGPEVSTLREVLTHLVRQEIADYERHREQSRTLRVLTPADLARGVESGSYGREQRTLPAPPPLDTAIERAIEAFGDGLFFVFVDGTQIEDLDAPVPLGTASTLRLVRLVALVGG
ncbi:hypothetical protein [Williamsia sp. CHRR-6]|uniref:hypothetical protein n=1 Tax=Williamsia sp. CHRR-6 TaxID=2835871 RepID=UPI001BDB0A34|nr:hypothetical protein [Williamsia sp. CHRR-6]MBT0566200.1 hypothetical protein [Williamsia sp. CHRR-6]